MTTQRDKCIFCTDPGRYDERLHNTEENVRKLWEKFDSVQKIGIGILATTLTTAIGTIATLLIMLAKAKAAGQ